MKQEVGTRITALRKLIAELDESYYAGSTTLTVEDEVYDSHMRELKALEEKNPDLITPDSPTQRVNKNKAKLTTKHSIPMLSIDNKYSKDELQKWFNSILSKLGGKADFLVQGKADGFALSLTYEDGKLIQGLSRGDGKHGEDMTKNSKSLLNVPMRIKHPGRVVIRGEVVISFQDFKRVNNSLPPDHPKYKNPRNLASGTMNSDSPTSVSSRGLEFVLHSFGEASTQEGYLTLSGFLAAMANDNHFSTPASFFVKADSENDFSLLWGAVEAIGASRDTSLYPLDGCVIKVDNLADQKKLGTTNKHIKYAVAYKYAADKVTTVVKRIIWQVGKTGAITPRAELEPVEIAGTTVSFVSVHNYTMVQALGLYDGCSVEVMKAGEIIPQIVRCLDAGESFMAKGSCEPPTLCPSCGSKLNVAAKELRCKNKNCKDKLVQRVLHFCARDQMDIEGMGDETVKLLFENEFISSLADIYKLKMRAKDIAQLPGMGEKSVAALLASIEQSKSRGLARLIPAIGVRSIGNTVGKKLASKFGSWDSTRIFANAENLTSIAGFGPNLINAIVEFVNDKSIIDLFDQFFSYGVLLTHVTEEAVEPIKLKGDIVLEWKHICVTGAYEVDNKKLKREDLEAKLESSGVKIQSSVTKTTDLLLIGNKPTKAKIDKANALNKPVMTLEQMCSHLGVSPSTFVS